MWEETTKAHLLKWDIHWSLHDSAVPCSPTARRPDFVFNRNTFNVVLEVDEDHHRFYSPACENARISEMKDSLRTPLILIRFSPCIRRFAGLEKLLLSVLAGGGTEAHNEHGVFLYFVGYPSSRVGQLAEAGQDSMSTAFPYEEIAV